MAGFYRCAASRLVVSMDTDLEGQMPLRGLHRRRSVLSLHAMILTSARYYFWFYGYPMPLAEVGARSS
ncbi:hypothetical protein [Dyella subtropica]|uniref:hypothetical protein n=1 Tax=Dyella subtropica TaxID=2992127 RepID=UPI00225B59ED|nr:hypothetical protein [Dyella subtropica]